MENERFEVKSVLIPTAIEMPLTELLRQISELSGLPLFYDSGDQNIINRKIIFISDKKSMSVDFDLVKALLEMNGIYLIPLKFSDGREVIQVSAPPLGCDRPPTHVIMVNGMEVIATPIDPDLYTTMIFDFHNINPSSAIDALEHLLWEEVEGKLTCRRSGSYDLAALEKNWRIVISAKFGLLHYLQTMMTLLDRPCSLTSGRKCNTVQVEWVEAAKISEVIKDIIPGVAVGDLSSHYKRSRNFSIWLIPDEYTNKIIILSLLDQNLDELDALIAELDVKQACRLLPDPFRYKFMKPTRRNYRE